MIVITARSLSSGDPEGLGGHPHWTLHLELLGDQEEGVEVRSKEGAILAEEYGSHQFESSESAAGPEPVKRKRKKLNFGQVKKVDKNKQERDHMNELKERARLEQIAHLKEKLGDPFDQLDFVQTRSSA